MEKKSIPRRKNIGEIPIGMSRRVSSSCTCRFSSCRSPEGERSQQLHSFTPLKRKMEKKGNTRICSGEFIIVKNNCRKFS